MNPVGRRRTYRSFTAREGLKGFQVRHRETDIYIQAESNLEHEVSKWIIEARLSIEDYARSRPGFLESHFPLPEDIFAPSIVQDMLKSSTVANVGPMAAVAGAIAQYVGKRCLDTTSGEVIVENGGDIFLWIRKPIKSAIWAGDSPFSGRIGIALPAGHGSMGICTSSGTVGHSRSLGRADAVTIVSQSASLADAAATSVGNMVKTESDIESGICAIKDIPGILGGVIIKGSKIGAWGEIELIPLDLSSQ